MVAQLFRYPEPDPQQSGWCLLMTSEGKRVDILVVEYQALKAEQCSRIGTRDNLIYATLAAYGAVLLGVGSRNASILFLLLIPAIGVLMGWTHLINDDKISAIGDHIQENIRPSLMAQLGGDDLFAWEQAHRSRPGQRRRKRLQLGADTLAFVLPACMSILVYMLFADEALWIQLAVVVPEFAGLTTLATEIFRRLGS